MKKNNTLLKQFQSLLEISLETKPIDTLTRERSISCLDTGISLKSDGIYEPKRPFQCATATHSKK
jgi:hypothetical protein